MAPFSILFAGQTSAFLALAFLANGAVAQTAEAPPPSTPSPQPAAPPSRDDDVAALRDEVRALRAEVEAQKTKKPEADVTTASPSRPLGYETVWPWILPPEGISSYAYVQSQYEAHQDSQAQLSASGTSLEKDRFSIRRARAALIGEWQYAAMILELDANTTNGPQVALHKAEASLQYRPDRNAPPLVMATMGLFDTPFGYELDESPRQRFFMERTTASQALFPGESDLGFRLAGAASFFRWSIAAQNGVPLGSASPYVEQDPTGTQDVYFRFGADTHPLPDLHVAGSLSAMRGTGFHAGATPAGSSLQWHDTNEDGAVQASELVGVAAQSGQPSQNFDRWAVGADLRMHYRWWLGTAKVYGEFVIAQNLDRGLYVADPVATGLDTRELGFYIAAEQEITKWGMVGLRYDSYDPNSNAFDKRGGSLIPFSEAITTWSPMAALVLPDRARLVIQYDDIHNAYARTALGVPTNLKDNVVTLRFQVQL